MAYNFLTQYNSPNYTPAGDAVATWGRPRTIEKIAIHWWDDPLNNPSFEGTINVLCNPARQASAHFVATGTGRRVACLVDIENASWATNSANPYSISIECDPRCRPEDYDVVGEIIAELRATYGNLPLMKHNDVVATRCPGNYDLNRLNAVAATKIAKATDQFGMATTKLTAPAPAPTPAPTPNVGYRVFDEAGKQVGAYSVAKNAYNKWLTTNRKGVIKDATGVDVTLAVVSKYEAPAPTTPVTPTPVPTTPSELDRIGAKVDANNALLTEILSLLKGLIAKITNIFK